MKQRQIEKGFTLLEVAVALGLLIMVFGSVVSLAILTRESEQASKNNLIAAYLAKEGQELVRYQRDKNYLDGASAFTSISTETDGVDYNFLIDYTPAIYAAASPDVTLADQLRINQDSNGNDFYDNNSGSGTVTIFRRLVTTTYHIAAGPLPAYIDVKVEVYWKSDTKKNTYTLTSQLTDWR